MQYLTLKQKRIIIIILAAIIVAVVAWLLYYFLTTGQINVTTNNQKNSVLITRLSDTGDPKKQSIDTSDHTGAPKSYINDSTGNTSVRVEDGVYLIKVSDNTGNSTAEIVTIHALDTKNVTLSIKPPTTVEPVSDRAATSLVATSSSLSYIDLTNNNLYTVGVDSDETLVDSDHSLQSIQWADSTYGIGRGSDNKLYVISGNSITPFDISSIHAADLSLISYLVLPDRTVFVSDGSTLYRFASNGSHTTSYVADSGRRISLYAGDKKGDVLLSETDGSQKTDKTQLVAVSDSGSITKKDGEVYATSWSPNGSYIALSGDEVNAIVDPKLQKVANLPSGNVNSPNWLNDTTLLYGISNQLWMYDVTTGSSRVIAATDSADAITGIVPDHDNNYVYFLDHQGNGNYKLMRVGLRNQKISPTSIKLSVFLPNNVDECVMGYINFTQLAVMVHGPDGSDSDCISKTQQYLTLYGVSLTGLSIFFNTNS